MNHATALFERTVAQGVKVSAVLRQSDTAVLNAEYWLSVPTKNCCKSNYTNFRRSMRVRGE